MQTGRHFAIIMILLLPAVCGRAAPSPSMSLEQRSTSAFLDFLSIPSPGEVFVALNKACRPNWATLVTPATAPVTTDRAQLAMAVGILATDGYIAVEAQDGQQVKNIGREIIAMAKALGVSRSLLGRGNSLVEFADSSAWDALADELAATEEEVKVSMSLQKDRDLVLLISAAAWTRGLETASQVVLLDESLRGEEVIRQPELASTLAARLDTLPRRLAEDPGVGMLRKTLREAAPLLAARGSTAAERRKNLQTLHEACASATRGIMASAKVTAAPAHSPFPPR